MIGSRGAAAGLYIHVPFCSHVCPYCDFPVTIAGPDRREGFLRAIAAEADLRSDCGLQFDTVYVGGGTPSSLDADQLQRILEVTRDALTVLPGAQFFLEVNPEDVTSDTAQKWRELCFDTISLGVQSFDDEILQRLGRRHGADRARQAVDTLCAAGFSTVSIDLIFGLAGQRSVGWRRQLEEAAERGVHHLSCYQLTFHTGTIFGRRLVRGEIVEMDGAAQSELFLLTHLLLGDLGYEGYEVSNFAAAPEHRSVHNQKYWNHAPYLGLGPSAHSFVGSRRWWNLRKLRLWTREATDGRLPVGGTEELSWEDLALEAVMLGVRTAAGIDVKRVESEFGVDLLATNKAVLERLFDAGHLVLESGMLRPTLSGMANSDFLARSLEVSTDGRSSPF